MLSEKNETEELVNCYENLKELTPISIFNLRFILDYCQAQFQLPSSVQVQTEISLTTTVRPHPPITPATPHF